MARRARPPAAPPPGAATPPTGRPAAERQEDPIPDDAVAFPLDGTLDLHTFAPRDVDSLVPEWIGACAEAGLVALRIVHGKGTGALRDRVHRLLRRDARVASFRPATEEAGGWGATLVELRKM